MPSQWETALLCNDISHWLGASLESALHIEISKLTFFFLDWCELDIKHFTYWPYKDVSVIILVPVGLRSASVCPCPFLHLLFSIFDDAIHSYLVQSLTIMNIYIYIHIYYWTLNFAIICHFPHSRPAEGCLPFLPTWIGINWNAWFPNML